MDLEFQSAVDAIKEYLLREWQTLLLSITQTERVSDLFRSNLRDPDNILMKKITSSALPLSSFKMGAGIGRQGGRLSRDSSSRSPWRDQGAWSRFSCAKKSGRLMFRMIISRRMWSTQIGIWSAASKGRDFEDSCC